MKKWIRWMMNFCETNKIDQTMILLTFVNTHNPRIIAKAQ